MILGIMSKLLERLASRLFSNNFQEWFQSASNLLPWTFVYRLSQRICQNTLSEMLLMKSHAQGQYPLALMFAYWHVQYVVQKKQGTPLSRT